MSWTGDWRRVIWTLLALLFARPVMAEETAGPAKAEPAALAIPFPEGCKDRTDVVGLSRVVEVDTAGGPRFGSVQYKGNVFLADREVVLTFDDGPARRYTQPILDALDQNCTRATFFVVGRMSLHDPDMLKEVARRGHTIGNHTWSHKNLAQQSAARAKEDIELGLSLTTMALGAPVAPFFRFPYLGDSKSNLAYLSGRDTGVFSIDVDPKDFATRDPEVVIKNVMGQLASKGRGIILFHDIQPATSRAMPKLLAELHKKGFKVVHIVPKGPASTLPEFDAMAKKMFDKKKKSGPAVASKGDVTSDALVQPAGGPAEVLPWEGDSVPQGTVPAEPEATAGPAKIRSRPFKVQSPVAADDPTWQLRGYIGD